MLTLFRTVSLFRLKICRTCAGPFLPRRGSVLLLLPRGQTHGSAAAPHPGRRPARRPSPVPPPGRPGPPRAGPRDPDSPTTGRAEAAAHPGPWGPPTSVSVSDSPGDVTTRSVRPAAADAPRRPRCCGKAAETGSAPRICLFRHAQCVCAPQASVGPHRPTPQVRPRPRRDPTARASQHADLRCAGAAAGSGTREVRLRGTLVPAQSLLPDRPERSRLRAAEGGDSILRTEGRVRTAQAWGAGPREGLRPRPACAHCACASRGRRLGLLAGAVRPAPAVWTQSSTERGG